MSSLCIVTCAASRSTTRVKSRFVSLQLQVSTSTVRKEIYKSFSSIARLPQLQAPFQIPKKTNIIPRISLDTVFCLFRSHNKTTARKFTTILAPVSFCNYFRQSVLKKNVQLIQNCRHSSKRAFEINTNLPQDVLVYSHKNENFYKMLTYFGVLQMFMWAYLSSFALRYLKTVPALTEGTSDLPWWKAMIYKEGQYKNAISILSLAVGGIVMFLTMTYPRRVVRKLSILKGGNDVQITTYTWFGLTRSFKIPVEHISCLQSRAGRGHHIPLKLKGKSFYFLVDKQGSFINTDLFDFVIALKRNFK
uniref:Transmembrane protein 223 n=1 Tax=Arion vulgaris TaxID=1028688 RepID=A0A0B6ZWQ4_9EUPU